MVWQQEHRLVYEDFIEKSRMVIVLFIGLFVFLTLRLFYLQVIRGNHYRTVSEQQRTHVILERAPRGIIYDWQGHEIVGNKTAFVALFYPFAQENTMPTRELLGRLKEILPVKDLSISIVKGWRSGKAVRLADNISLHEMFRLQEQRLVLPGISVVKEARRHYHAPEANAHLIGYLNEISERELETFEHEGYKSGDWMGRGGIEQVYNGLLRGQDGGWQIEVNAFGQETRLVHHVVPVPGNSVHTTIDERLQEAAYRSLMETPSGRGAVVAIDPRTGAVRSIVSSPGFDPTLSFSRDFSQYLVDRRLPLFNRAIQGLYPPGSIFKVISYTAAVAENKMNPAQTHFCSGSFTFGNKTFSCWEKKGHGAQDLVGALQNSCNVYFFHLGLKTGAQLIEKYAREFRLGELTGIEMPSEKKGLVPSSEWKLNKMREAWHPGDTLNMAIGQGPLWITPIQAAVMTAAVANHGIVYQPYVVDKITTPKGEMLYRSQVRKKGEVRLPERAWQLLHYGLETVVQEGTGRSCRFSELRVAGKTGTAQNPHGKDHAWFVAYAPVEKPELAVAILVENGGGGGAVAGPVARKMFETYFNLAPKAPPVRQKKAPEAGDTPGNYTVAVSSSQ